MEKRVMLAFVLSAVIFAVWSVMFPPPKPQRPEERAAAESTEEEPEQSGPVELPVAPVGEDEEGVVAEAVSGAREQTVVLANPEMEVEISNRGAAITAIRLLQYEGDEGGVLDLVQTVTSPQRAVPLQLVLNAGVDERLYSMTVESRTASFEWGDGRGTRVTKRFEIPEQGYGIDFEVGAQGDLKDARLAVGTGLRDFGAAEQKGRLAVWGDGVYLDHGKVARLKRAKQKDPVDVAGEGVAFAGLQDTYFLQVVVPRTAVSSIAYEPVIFDSGEHDEGKKEESGRALRVTLGSHDGTFAGRLWGVPKEYRLLHRIGGGLEKTLDFGMFGVISVFFLKVLWWVYGKVGNYGLGIVLLTVGIRIILFPLMHTSTVSMRRMQKMQPRIKAIQAKYKKSKSDPQMRAKMNQEVMALYKEEGINPMGGCLPMLVQLPILWALYRLFMYAIELRHAPFVWWIQDLSAKDPTFVTPILMTGTMWLQQRLAPQAGDPQQQKIFRWMPLIFGVMFLQFPAGLVLYWLANNVLTIIQQEITLRLIGERKAASGSGKGKRR
jgi:YidC/Oxa1 family membrane protein insertase